VARAANGPGHLSRRGGKSATAKLPLPISAHPTRVSSRGRRLTRIKLLPTAADDLVVTHAALRSRPDPSITDLIEPMSSFQKLIHQDAAATGASGEIASADLALHTRALRSVGILSRGLAHDINSPLQVLSDATFLLREGLAELEPTTNPRIIDGLRMATEQANQAFDRLRTLTKSVAMLVPPTEPARSLVRLEDELGVVQALTRHEWHRDVELTMCVDPRISLVAVPRPLLRQLLVDMILCVVHDVVQSQRDNPPAIGRRQPVVVRAFRTESQIVIEVIADGLRDASPSADAPLTRYLEYEPLLSRLGVIVSFRPVGARAEIPVRLAQPDGLFT
jgi:hypothetical protein